MLHEKVHAVFFQRDGIRIILGNALDDLHVADVELVATGGTLVGADLAFDDHTRFLGQRLDRVEYFRRNRVLWHHTLDHTRAVTKLRKQQLPALAQVVEPAADGDGLAFVFADLNDGGYRG